jgi:argininosuccinate synthase
LEEWGLKSRKDLVEYAKAWYTRTCKSQKPYSCDRNLFHTSYEGGILEDPWKEPAESMFEMSISPEKAPDEPTYLDIGFERGEPVSIDGKNMPPLEIISTLNRVGGGNGVGRVDLVENRFVGIKSRSL